MEQRGCWQERPATTPAPATEPALWTGTLRRRTRDDTLVDPAEAAPLDFIPVELVGRVLFSAEVNALDHAPVESADRPLLPHLAAEPDESWTDRTSLFGELEA
jgi:hypothetical protein